MTHEGLVEQARQLADRVGGLSLAVEQLDKRTNRSERITIGVVFGLALDLVLSIAVAIVLSNQVSTNARLQGAIDREQLTRQEAVCPLYSLLLGSYRPESRAPGVDRDQYNATFDVMRKARDTLECAGPLTPPATPR